MDPETLRRMRATWEAIDHRWNEWVLQYSNDDQMQLLRSWGWPSPDWETLGRILALALATLALGSALMLKFRPTLVRQHAWRRPNLRMDRALRRLMPDMPATAPAPASVWHAHLLSAWTKSSLQLDNNRQALLQTLLDLDASRYGPQALADKSRLPAHVRPMIRQVERLARACRLAPDRPPRA